MPSPSYNVGDLVATREAFGSGLVKLGSLDARVVALDADVKNSTFSERFEQAYPERFYQAFIAEQVMVGMAMGLASRGALPFPSTFACFLSRAYDFIRMAGISNLAVKLAGSHAGISIGEDGPSQMGLEDLAMMRAVPNCTVLYPCDAVSTEKLMAVAAFEARLAYIRLSRPKVPVIYSVNQRFSLGGSHVLRESPDDVVTIVAAGVTVFEALKAHDELAAQNTRVRVIDAYSIQPLDVAGLLRAAHMTNRTIITVEDHYLNGGLGEAVSGAVETAGISVHRLAVREIPRSGKPEELLDRYGISASHIVKVVTDLRRPQMLADVHR
jgi:transketolase